MAAVTAATAVAVVSAGQLAPGDGAERPRRLVPAVDRAARALVVLRDADGARSLTEVAVALGINKATVLDILLTLCHHGLSQRDPATKRFTLGPALAGCAPAAWRAADLRAAARPVLHALSERVGETSALGVNGDGRLLILDGETARGDFPLAVPVGRELPLVATSLGKVLCAYLPEVDLAAALRDSGLPRFTAQSVTDEAVFRGQLAAVRARGYTLDRGEYADGVFGLAAAVRGRGGVPASIAVVGLLGRLSPDRELTLRSAVVDAASALSWRLGGGDAEEPSGSRERGTRPAAVQPGPEARATPVQAGPEARATPVQAGRGEGDGD